MNGKTNPRYGMDRYLLQLRTMLLVAAYVDAHGHEGLKNVARPLKADILEEIVRVEFLIENPYKGY